MARCSHTMKAKTSDGKTYCCDCGKILDKAKAAALLRAYAAEEITLNRALECIQLWARGEDFTLPTFAV